MRDWGTWLRWGIPIALGLAMQAGTFYLNSAKDNEVMRLELEYLGKYIQTQDTLMQHRMDRIEDRINQER